MNHAAKRKLQHFLFKIGCKRMQELRKTVNFSVFSTMSTVDLKTRCLGQRLINCYYNLLWDWQIVPYWGLWERLHDLDTLRQHYRCCQVNSAAFPQLMIGKLVMQFFSFWVLQFFSSWDCWVWVDSHWVKHLLVWKVSLSSCKRLQPNILHPLSEVQRNDIAVFQIISWIGEMITKFLTKSGH